MKTSYIVFAVVIVALILAFSFSSSYLTSLEKEAKGTTESVRDQAGLDSLKREMTTRMNEFEAVVDLRLDSLESQFRERSARSEALEALDSLKDDAVSARAERSKVAKGPAPVPTSGELKIYQDYLARRWALPKDLSTYELKVAKNEILQELATSHRIPSEEVQQIVDKVYEFRKNGGK